MTTVYYNYQVYSDDHPELCLCDIDHPEVITYHLSLAGQMILLHPTLYKWLLQDKDTFQLIFAHPPGANDLNRRSKNFTIGFHLAHELTDEGGRPSMEHRRDLYRKLVILKAYRVYHHYLYFMAPVWIKLSSEFLHKQPEEETLQDRFNDCKPLGRKAFELFLNYAGDMDRFYECGESTIISLLSVPEIQIENSEERRKWLHKMRYGGGVSALVIGAVR